MEEILQVEIAEKFNSYPEPMVQKMMFLRQLIFDTASELEKVGAVEESLKWGEPSYRAKTGSAIRIDWKKKTPDQYMMYFHCKTKLVSTFKELYRDDFHFDGNRAIIFGANEVIPVDKLKQCVALALTYHRVKHLPMLGV